MLDLGDRAVEFNEDKTSMGRLHLRDIDAPRLKFGALRELPPSSRPNPCATRAFAAELDERK